MLLRLCMYFVASSRPAPLAHCGVMTEGKSTPAYTHILGCPVNQNVISTEPQILSLFLLLTANYEALQLYPVNQTQQKVSLFFSFKHAQSL